MPFNCPDIDTFKAELDNNLFVAQNMRRNSHATIKIQSLLNITIYALATRFLEGCVKLIIYNCAIMRGDSPTMLAALETALKSLNNPEYSNIRDEFIRHLSFDIGQGLISARFSASDLSFLNEIVKNRHRNVHATHAPSDWYGRNLKDIISDFPREYVGLINILTYLDSIHYNALTASFSD